MNRVKAFIFRCAVIDKARFLLTVEDYREVKVDAIPQVRTIISFPEQESTQHVPIGQLRPRTAGRSTHSRRDLPRIIRENQLVAAALRVDIDVLGLCILCTENLPQLVEDVTSHTLAHILRDRLYFPIQSLRGSTIGLARSQLNRVVAITEMVNELDKHTGLDALAYRDETEKHILLLAFIGTVANCKVQIAGKHAGAQHEVRGEQVHVDRLFQEFLQLGVVGLDTDAVADLVEDSLVLREPLGILARMQLLAQALELLRTQREALILLHMFQEVQQFTALGTLKAAETRRFGETHILVTHRSSQAQHIRGALEIKEARLTTPVGTADKESCVQRQVFLARNVLILHHRCQMVKEFIPAPRQKVLDSLLLVTGHGAVVREALCHIAVDFIGIASRNLLRNRQGVSIQFFTELGRVEIRLPLAEGQVVEQVDNIQVNEVSFNRVIREVGPDGRSLRDGLSILRDVAIQSRPGSEKISMGCLVAGHKQFIRHDVAVLHQLHVSRADISRFYSPLPFLGGCRRHNTTVVGKGDAVHIENSKHQIPPEKTNSPHRDDSRHG